MPAFAPRFWYLECYPLPMGILFLSITLACLIVLIWRKYWRLFPCFVLAQAATVWQAGARLFVITSDRTSWMHIWVPGERILLLATGVALLEAVWRSVEQMSKWPRVATYLGLIVFASFTAFAVHTDVSGDWYDRFWNTRTWIFLGFGIFACAGVLVGLLITRVWPRAASMHMGLYSALMVGHVSFVQSAFFTWANTHYRFLAMACCVGWVINSGFLKNELGQVARAQKSLRAALRLPHGSAVPVLPAARSASLVR